MLGIKSWIQLPVKFPPLTDEEILDINMDTRDAIHCTAQNFRVDFLHPWKKFTFNAEAAFVFTAEFLKAIRNGRYADKKIPRYLLVEDQVSTALDIHMPYVRSQYHLYHDHEKEVREARIDTTRKRKAANSRKGTVRY